MRSFGTPSLGLTGSLLIAHPNLLDPNFKRTVLYLPVHNPADGSFGLILNRPTGRTVEHFLPDQELGRIAGVPVFIGGPVAPDQITFAALSWNAADGVVECQTHIGIEDAWKVLDAEDASLRAFVGYSGWSGGQLESELAQKAWLVQKPDRNILDIGKCSDLWRVMLREQGPWFRLLASAPEDPSMN